MISIIKQKNHRDEQFEEHLLGQKPEIHPLKNISKTNEAGCYYNHNSF